MDDSNGTPIAQNTAREAGAGSDLNELGEPYPPTTEETRITRLNTLQIRDRQFDMPICLEGNVCSEEEEIEFKHCFIPSISVKRITAHSIHFFDCRIGRIVFYGTSCPLLAMTSCTVESVIVDNCAQPARVVLADTACNTLHIIEKTLEELTIVNRSVIGDITFEKGAAAQTITIGAAKVGCVHLDKMPNCSIKNGGQLDRLYVNSLRIDELWRRFRAYRKKDRVELERFAVLVLAVQASFTERNMFAETDRCLCLLRSINYWIRIKQTKNRVGRACLVLGYAVIGKCFGWGIRITNNLITMLAVIVLFACGYLIAAGGTPWEALFSSVLYFFSIIDITRGTTVAGIQIAESIFGIFYLTVITGVIVRKIIK